MGRAPIYRIIFNETRIGRVFARHTPRICAVVHVAAAAATVAWIAGGSEAESNPVARGAFVAAHTATWRAAWMIWMLAAITLGGFFCWWAARSAKPRLARAALVVGCAGIVADFFADALFIGWVPERYASLAPFTTIVSEVVANGLYSIAGAILMVASAPLRPAYRALGWTVWLAGFTLAIAGAMRWNVAIVISSGILLATFIPWAWLANCFLDESL